MPRDERLASPGPRTAAAIAADVAIVGLFALAGRRSHQESLSLDGWWQTAWPFMAGLAIGWVVVVSTSGTWPTRAWHGITVWLATVFAGMAFRDVTGQGTAWSFVLVAALVLGAGLIGWRTVMEYGDRRVDAERKRERAEQRRGSRPVVEHTEVGDPLDLEGLTGPRDQTKGRGVVPEADRARRVEEMLKDPRSGGGSGIRED